MLLVVGTLNHERASAIDLKIKGTLSHTPCIIKPENQNMVVDFGNVVSKYILFNGRTPPAVFRLVLSECDGLKNKVSITFKGNKSANPNNSGMLKLNGAQGIYVNIETESGVQLPIDTPSSFHDLPHKENSIAFKAFVVGGINEEVTLGAFSGEAVIVLDYSY